MATPEATQTYDATLVIKCGYRGAGFAGYAEQEGQRTVAGELRRALETLLRREVDMTCAGRTDAGVSAISQYVSLPVTCDELASSSPSRLWRSLMAITDEDVSIKGLYTAPQGFSARFDAQSRSYRYRIASGNAQPVLAWDYCWWVRSPLDVSAMAEAASPLVGEHDFRSFCKVSSATMLEEAGRSLSRNVEVLEVSEVTECGEDLIAVDVRGNAFLHNMVRIIVGTLVEVGRHNRDNGFVLRALEAKDRRAAGPTAPAKGLVFTDVTYPAGQLTPFTDAHTNMLKC